MSTDATVGTVTVTHHDANGTWVIALEGEHDLASVPLLEHETAGIWARCTVAVIDLCKVTFLDCSTISWLLRSHGALPLTGHSGVRIVECPPASTAARVFSLMELSDLLACYPTRQAALAHASA